MSRVADQGQHADCITMPMPHTQFCMFELYLSHAVVTDSNLSLNLIVWFENIRFIYDPLTTCVFVHFYCYGLERSVAESMYRLDCLVVEQS